ncbi:hypothetical protein IFO70_26220 [Phormidium tenue FACHB-886]|nr:hypothetical protein [Phormidium tenue FACHB-886]
MLIPKLFWADEIVIFSLLVFSIVAVALIIKWLVFWVRVNRWQQKVAHNGLQAYLRDFGRALLRLKTFLKQVQI